MTLHIAGYNDSGVLACERYDVQKDIWKEISALPNSLCKSGAAAGHDGCVLLLGGKLGVMSM